MAAENPMGWRSFFVFLVILFLVTRVEDRFEIYTLEVTGPFSYYVQLHIVLLLSCILSYYKEG